MKQRKRRPEQKARIVLIESRCPPSSNRLTYSTDGPMALLRDANLTKGPAKLAESFA